MVLWVSWSPWLKEQNRILLSVTLSSLSLSAAVVRFMLLYTSFTDEEAETRGVGAC